MSLQPLLLSVLTATLLARSIRRVHVLLHSTRSAEDYREGGAFSCSLVSPVNRRRGRCRRTFRGRQYHGSRLVDEHVAPCASDAAACVRLRRCHAWQRALWLLVDGDVPYAFDNCFLVKSPLTRLAAQVEPYGTGQSGYVMLLLRTSLLCLFEFVGLLSNASFPLGESATAMA